MNKAQLVQEVALEMDTSKAQAARAVEAVVSSITTGIKQDESVTIMGFGSFSKKQRKARIVLMPGSTVEKAIPARQTVGFKPSAMLKAIL